MQGGVTSGKLLDGSLRVSGQSIFGDRTSGLADSVARCSGISSWSGKLMAMLAPLAEDWEGEWNRFTEAVVFQRVHGDRR
jgi:hypothetical protein